MLAQAQRARIERTQAARPPRAPAYPAAIDPTQATLVLRRDHGAAMSPPEPLPELAAKLRFLQSPAAWEGAHTPVESIETHMSWVFVAGDRVLKLKKPVRHEFLDFSTLQAREFYCREELRLNARLAPGVYLDVLALQWHDGRFALLPSRQLPAPGRTVDWLVLMRRLPAQHMLDRRIAAGRVTPADIEPLRRVLVDFYRRSPVIGVDPRQHLQRLRSEQQINRRVLLDPRWQLPGSAAVLDRLDAAQCRLAPALQACAADGRLRDGHGDLRPEHVCLLQPPVVIDCLEFNPALRQVDPFDEIAYLGLECDMAGAPWIGEQLLRGCAEELGGGPDAALLQLYIAQRAVLRARLALAHLLDQVPRTPRRWPAQALRYLEHAQRALDALDAQQAGHSAVAGPPPQLDTGCSSAGGRP
jgi:aminoglycoside phosphotransferase family enzyme